MMYLSDIGVEQGRGSHMTPLCFALSFFYTFHSLLLQLAGFFWWCHNKCETHDAKEIIVVSIGACLLQTS